MTMRCTCEQYIFCTRTAFLSWKIEKISWSTKRVFNSVVHQEWTFSKKNLHTPGRIPCTSFGKALASFRNKKKIVTRYHFYSHYPRHPKRMTNEIFHPRQRRKFGVSMIFSLPMCIHREIFHPPSRAEKHQSSITKARHRRARVIYQHRATAIDRSSACIRDARLPRASCRTGGGGGNNSFMEITSAE